MSNFTGWGGNFQGWGGAGAAASVTLPSVVLFPVEPLHFRRRWDKTAYAWACLTRDMRAPAGGYRHNRDHLVSVAQAMRA